MATIINFGKHNGKRFDQVPVSYLQWMAEQDIVRGGINFSAEARAYLQRRNMDVRFTTQEREEAREADRQQELADEEYDAKHLAVRWTANNGKSVAVYVDFSGPLTLIVDEKPVFGAIEFSPVPAAQAEQAKRAGVVAMLGYVGITAERKALIEAKRAELRREWEAYQASRKGK